MEKLTKHEERLALLLWFRLARFYHNSVRASNKHLSQWHLTTAQFDVLVQVGVHQPIAQQTLAKKLFVTKGNVTQLIRKMEERDVIVRKQEWKTKYITLTSEGKKLFNKVAPMQESFQANHFQGLDEQEQKQLLKLLGKLHPQEE